MATEALTRLDGHEKACGDRWIETREAIKALTAGHRSIVHLLLGGQGAIILFLAGLIVTLLFTGK
jgi:hypothetical protein